MAGTYSDFLENKLLDHLLATASWTMPAAVYIALFTTNPNFETGAGGTEASGGSYARKSAIFSAASGGATTGPTVAKTWTVGTDIAAGTYVGYGVYDASVAGNLLFGEAFSASKVLTNTGDTLTFAIGSISVSQT